MAGRAEGGDLASDPAIDLATVALDYEGFRRLGRNPHLSANERIGFPDAYRAGHDAAILADIADKLAGLGTARGLTVLDIGPGCAALPRMLTALCTGQGHRLVLMDSPEMLDQLPDHPATDKRAGMFPRDHALLDDLAGGVDLVLCYSVFHYVVVDANPFTFLDRCIALLRDGGRALIGDIPNLSKRRRFFASPAGAAFHRAFTGTDTAPPQDPPGPVPLKIDDALLAGLVARAQAAGCDAYLLPQPPGLPMANRRDDLLLVKP